MTSTPPADFHFLPHSSLYPLYHPSPATLPPSRHLPPDYADDYQSSDSIATQSLEHQIDAFLAQSSGDYPAQHLQAASRVPTALPHQGTTPTPLAALITDLPHDLLASVPLAYDFYDAQHTSMGDVVGFHRGAPSRARTHQRTPSASTIASNGPASPYSANAFHPQIANSDVSPNSPLSFVDNAFIAKSYPSEQFMSGGSYMPGPSSITPQAFGMKGFSNDNSQNEDIPDFIQSSRLSMSTNGNNSPATPLSGTTYGEVADGRNGNGAYQNDYRQQPNPQVQLYRTESSQAYADELYNPATTYTSAPAQVPALKAKTDYLSPHRNVLNERLQNANQIRSASPLSTVSRERSPFRETSPWAASGDWRNGPQMHMGSAAEMRKRQKEQVEQAEYAQHVPQMRREATKTISPKDAVLDYNEPDQPSLFQESIPAGYRQHGGWQGGFAPGPTYGNLPAGTPQPQQMPTFRASSSQSFGPNVDFNFAELPLENGSQPQMTQMSAAPLQQANYAAPKMNYLEANPEFPPSLVTMESSISENGPPLSSQESTANAPAISQPTIARPTDTRANTGTYQCPYHNCTQRFESSNELQKHTRETHRRQQQEQQRQQRQASHETRSSTGPAGNGSVSPRSSSESPEPTSESGMTQADLAARNSQAGPHKCTRINPSTGKPCNTIFSRPYDLTRHEDTIHNNRKHKVRCEYCREEKTFSRNDALTRHMRVVHPEVESFGKRGRRE